MNGVRGARHREPTRASAVDAEEYPSPLPRTPVLLLSLRAAASAAAVVAGTAVDDRCCRTTANHSLVKSNISQPASERARLTHAEAVTAPKGAVVGWRDRKNTSICCSLVRSLLQGICVAGGDRQGMGAKQPPARFFSPALSRSLARFTQHKRLRALGGNQGDDGLAHGANARDGGTLRHGSDLGVRSPPHDIGGESKSYT